MIRWMLLMILLPATAMPGWSQRLFSIKMDSLSRSYLLVEASPEGTRNLPLIILLHDRRVTPFALAQMEWSRLTHSCIMVFPVALRNQWSCQKSTDSLKADKAFLLRIIFELRGAFRTDPSRVFIVGMGSAFCLADAFAKENAAWVRPAVRWSHAASAGPAANRDPFWFDSLVRRNPPVAVPRIDTVQVAGEPSFTLGLHVGRWQHAKAVRTEFDSLTMTDLTAYHFQFGFEVGYHFSKRWLAFISSDFMIIPRERKLNSISWGGGQGLNVRASGNGGIIIPYGIGVRYILPYENVRPFVSASFGSTFLYIGGGKASGGPGSIDKDIVKRKTSVFRYALGTGIDLRVSPVTSLQLTTQYTLSSRIEPALASVNRFQGLSITIGLRFILNRK